MLVEKNNNLFSCHTLNSTVPGPNIIITAGIHGDEFEPMLAAMNLVKRLERKLLRGSVTIIPVVNVAAFEASARCAPDGLDLARTFPGKKNGSSTETTAQQLTGLIKQADYLIDLHTGGQLFDILPLTGYLLHSDKKVLEKQRKLAAAFNLPVIWGTDANVEGRTLSIAREFGIPAIYAECRGGLRVNKKTITLYENGCINILQTLGMLNQKTKRQPAVSNWLEDHRPGQGHLQSKLPSPAKGIFVPEVSLGKLVKKGNVIGAIIDPASQQRTKLFAEENGILFMLRISSKVNLGDTLGGILPITKKGRKTIHAK